MADEKTSKNIIDTGRYKYERTTISDGRRKVHSKDNGDPIAVAMRGMSTEDVAQALKDNDLWDDRYARYVSEIADGIMGSGRFRMTAGQAIRYRWRRGEKTVIRGEEIVPYVDPKASDQAA